MKTPYYSGDFTAAQHTDVHDDDQLRERMLAHRLEHRDDVRDIYIVTALPINLRISDRVKDNSVVKGLVDKVSDPSKSDLSWMMHWAVQVGDQFFELQRDYPDVLRTGWRMSQWNQEQQSRIHARYRQGTTAMDDHEIKAAGERYFSRLERIDINIYDIWCNNCQIAIDHMLRDIGGLSYYRSKLESLHELVRQFFYNSILSIMKMYGRYRGWNEELIDKYTFILHKTLRVMTSRARYPKRHWIRSDVEKAEGALKKFSAVTDHWVLTVLESSLSLRKNSEELYVRRGVDGKPELNFDALRSATKGIFDDDDKNWQLAWLKAIPWLTAGFLVGTPRWAAAVISVALSHASQLHEERAGIRKGLQPSMLGSAISPKQPVSASMSKRPTVSTQRRSTIGPRRMRAKTLSIESKLIPRYERCLSPAGIPYFIDHMKKSRSWDAPEEQEMCLKIKNPPLSKKWEERLEDGRTVYVNRITGDMTESRPGASEVWAVKKRVRPDWVKSTNMALPCGWEMRRNEEGEMFYLNHNNNPPTSSTLHPMRQEIEHERRGLLPEWNVEWDNDRGKKYRNIQTGEIRWKEVDGPRCVPVEDRTKIIFKKADDDFVEPLPPGWTVTIEDDGQTVYKNNKTGKDMIERRNHPLTDKRRRLQPEWEMRYTPGRRRYWVHYGNDGRGTAWWTRNRLLKNTSLKNNASGWKLSKTGDEWEWFEAGDVPHSEIPVLDLDDPADMEFREYPFILPPKLTTEVGEFLEPLPPTWVRRTTEDENVHYWNFKDEVRSKQHPNDEERRNLPALWEMRFTRHGRQYFVDHDDGSTWWTHPREEKHKQILRAGPGQGQNGWKIAEDGKTWERFEDPPDAENTEQNANGLSHTDSNEDEALPHAQAPEKWRSLSFPREFLKSVNSSEVVANARTHIPKTPKLFRKQEKSPSKDSIPTESPQGFLVGEDLVEEESLAGTPELTDEPQSVEEIELDISPQQDPKTSFTPLLDQMKKFRKQEKQRSITSSPVDSPLEAKNQEAREETAAEPPEAETPVSETDLVEWTVPSHDQLPPATPARKDSKKGWAKRTTSGLLALKKKAGKKNSENTPILPEEKLVTDNDLQPIMDDLGITTETPIDDLEITNEMLDGLGITSTESFDSGMGAAVLAPIEEKEDNEEVGAEREVVGKAGSADNMVSQLKETNG